MYEIVDIANRFYIQTNMSRTLNKKFQEKCRSSRPEPQACNVIKKEVLAQVFSCEFYEISKKTFSYRTPPVAASVDYFTTIEVRGIGIWFLYCQ